MDGDEFDLERALSSHPLPDSVNDVKMNVEEIAGTFRVSTNTVSKWLKLPGFPVVEHGTNGRAYVLKLSHVWAYRHWQDEREQRASEQVKRSQSQMAMHLLGVDGKRQANLDPVTYKQMVAAERERMVTERMRRMLVQVEDVHALLDDLVGIFRGAVNGFGDRLERELSLTASEVTAVQDAVDDMLNEIADCIERSGMDAGGTAETSVQNMVM
jgi:hypothetical protein